MSRQDCSVLYGVIHEMKISQARESVSILVDQAFIHIWIFESEPLKLYFCFIQQEESTSIVSILLGESDFVSD